MGESLSILFMATNQVNDLSEQDDPSLQVHAMTCSAVDLRGKKVGGREWGIHFRIYSGFMI